MSSWIQLWAIPHNKLIYIPVEYKLEFIESMFHCYLRFDTKYINDLSTEFSICVSKNDFPKNICHLIEENPLISEEGPTKTEFLFSLRYNYH